MPFAELKAANTFKARRQTGTQWRRLCVVLLIICGLQARAFPEVITGQQVTLSRPLTVHWRYASGQTLNLTPAADAERVYLPLAGGSLVSLRAATGHMLWRAEIGGELSASPVADQRGVYIASETLKAKGKEAKSTGTVRLVGRESGVTLWVRELPLPLRTALAMSGETIFGGAADGQIYALRKKNGETLWSKQFPAPFASHLTLLGQRIYIGSEDGWLYSLEQKSGRTLWRYQTRGAIRGRVAVADGVVYFGSADGFVYAVDERDGRLKWRSRTGAGVQSVLSVKSGLLAASLDNFVYFLSLESGDRLWKRQLAGRLAAEPLATFDGALFTPLSGDSGVVLDFRDGKQINTLPLGEDANTSASPIIAGNYVVVTTRQGLLAFSNPQDTSKRR